MKQSKKWMLVALALLAMVALPLVGCKNDSVSEPVSGTETPPKIPSNVDSLIEELSGEGTYDLEATGNWSADDLSTLASELKDENKKVNLDLSKVSDLTTIGNGAFSGCSSLTSITIPASVKTIGGDAFFQCSSLKSITIPASVKTIGGDAFHRCSSLTTVTFENGSKLETIGGDAFHRCSSLESITIPDSVTTIETSAFRGCSSLDTVTMEAKEPPTLGVGVFDGTADTLQILVPSVDNYTNEAAKKKGWEPYKDKIPE